MAAPGSSAYTITGQHPGQGPNAAGLYTTGVVVSFRTADGDTGEVFFPADEYTAANVAKVVGEHVATMAAVRKLGAQG